METTTWEEDKIALSTSSLIKAVLANESHNLLNVFFPQIHVSQLKWLQLINFILAFHIDTLISYGCHKNSPKWD